VSGIDVPNLAGDERRPLEMEDPVDDVTDLARAADRWS